MPPVSGRSVWGGYTLPLIIAVFGILGVTLDGIFLLAFFVALGYYLYRMEKRISELEANPAARIQPAKKPDKQ